MGPANFMELKLNMRSALCNLAQMGIQEMNKQTITGGVSGSSLESISTNVYLTET